MILNTSNVVLLNPPPPPHPHNQAQGTSEISRRYIYFFWKFGPRPQQINRLEYILLHFETEEIRKRLAWPVYE